VLKNSKGILSHQKHCCQTQLGETKRRDHPRLHRKTFVHAIQGKQGLEFPEYQSNPALELPAREKKRGKVLRGEKGGSEGTKIEGGEGDGRVARPLFFF